MSQVRARAMKASARSELTKPGTETAATAKTAAAIANTRMIRSEKKGSIADDRCSARYRKYTADRSQMRDTAESSLAISIARSTRKVTPTIAMIVAAIAKYM